MSQFLRPTTSRRSWRPVILAIDHPAISVSDDPMTTPTRVLAVASLVTISLSVTACSREEPEPPGEPIVVRAAPLPKSSAQPAAAARAPVEYPPPDGVRVLVSSDQDGGEPPLSVRLEAQIREGSGTPPYTYNWDFGDGSPFASTDSVTHVYKIPGSFRASVVVTDKTGKTDQDYADIDVERPDSEAADVTPMTNAEALEILRKGQQRMGEEQQQSATKGDQKP
jgi:PKD repeat protein